jgi:hypothetical protein
MTETSRTTKRSSRSAAAPSTQDIICAAFES